MRPRKVVAHGRARWMIEFTEGGKRKRRFFPSALDAKAFIARRERERSSVGQAWSAVPDRDRSEMMAALERAKLGGYSLLSACEHYERQSVAAVKRKPIQEAFAEYVVAKRAQNLKAFSLGLLEASLQRFTDAFTGQNVSGITMSAIETHLAERGGAPKSRRNWIGELNAFFDWCSGRGYCGVNPCSKIPRPIITQGTPEVLTPAQAAALMATTREREPELVPLMALCLFAGLRTGEARQMTWQAIDLGAGHLTVGESIAKTRRRRLVPIPGNLAAWLELGGTLPAGRVDDRVSACRKAAGIEHWPRNVMRHSFCSYHLSLHGSAAQTALAAGHSETMLFQHYREIVRPAEAEKFFAISPG